MTFYIYEVELLRPYIRLENEYEIDFNINSSYQANKLVNSGQIRHYPVVEIV